MFPNFKSLAQREQKRQELLERAQRRVRQANTKRAKIASINGDLTPELVNGLLDYQTWSLTNRVLIADVSRLTERDVPQAIQIQGTNAGCQGTNMLVIVVSEQELTFDRLTGEVIDFTTA
ncbi:hypothetical protein PC120_g1222 [Phytophthora cactorum]|nr:hypothetical protein PC120_g1222 [Phytophthora cactorum]